MQKKIRRQKEIVFFYNYKTDFSFILRMATEALVYARIREIYRHPTKLFPTQQPQSLERSNMDAVFNSKNYVVSQKSDGHQVALLFTKIDRLGPVCCLFDRRERLFFYEVFCPVDLFNNTLIIGEKIDDLFLAFDVVSYCGRSLLHENYRTRLESSNFFSERVETGEIDFRSPKIQYRTKPVYSLDDFINSFVSVSADDGLIFMQVEQPLTRTLPLKWKQQHTVDLLVEATRSASAPFQYIILQPPGIGDGIRLDTESALLKTAEDLATGSSICKFKVVVECLVSLNGVARFIPVKFRHDKIGANLAATVLSTIKCVEENITLDEIIERFHRCK
jgi:mRNA capping enzyme, catalytic domain